MGPIVLFDKSFLQSLSVDESVWFDNFFISNICPLFYVETLADLEKKGRKGRSPEKEVRIIAEKLPDTNGAPSVHHTNLYIGNLMGHPVPMTGQICQAGGRQVRVDGKTGVIFEPSPEADAFLRWRRGDFLGVERLYAKEWRKQIASIDLEEMFKYVSNISRNGNKNCKTLEEAKGLAERIVNPLDRSTEVIQVSLIFRNVPEQLHQEVLTKWKSASFPPLSTYAPYAAHMLTVELFSFVAMAANLISARSLSEKNFPTRQSPFMISYPHERKNLQTL